MKKHQILSNAILVVLLTLFIQACGGGSGGGSSPPPEPPAVSPESVVEFVTNSDFIFAQTAIITTDSIDELEKITFTIETKPGNVSQDISVSYSRAYMQSEGLIDNAAGTASITVFGLYPDYRNVVDIELFFSANFSDKQQFTVTSGVFDSEYALPDMEFTIREPDIQFGFMMINSVPIGPVIVDIDGEVRWQAPYQGERNEVTYFSGDHFVVGGVFSSNQRRIYWDGRSELYLLADERFTESHHNLESGKLGLLHEKVLVEDNRTLGESALVEADQDGNIINEWIFDDILNNRIVEFGEDPSSLVVEGVDWFHMNSAIYDPSDDSIIASSRENFVIKVDYDTGEIKWILGNVDKTWYTDFPNSLQPLALDIVGAPPIGQHALSLSDNGQFLMLFNNGAGNLNLPNIGDTLTFSSVSIYDIDPVEKTATEIWNFDYSMSIYSPFCSSAYRTHHGDVIINYAMAENLQTVRIVLVTEEKQVLFDAVMPKREVDRVSCFTSYIVKEIKLDDMLF